jgi:hypothetical protein
MLPFDVCGYCLVVSFRIGAALSKTDCPSLDQDCAILSHAPFA